MRDSFECQVRVTFNGEELHMNKILTRFDLEDIMPPRDTIIDPSDLFLLREREERRERFVNIIAAEFAHSLTEALFKKARR